MRNLESTKRFFFLNSEGSLCNCLSSDQKCKLQGCYTEYVVLTLLRTKEDKKSPFLFSAAMLRFVGRSLKEKLFCRVVFAPEETKTGKFCELY